MKTHLMIFLGYAGLSVFAGETILFQSNFAGNRKLTGWDDLWSDGLPSEKHYRIVEKNDEVFLQTGKLVFGISHRFNTPVKVDDRLQKIEVEIEFRQPPESFSCVNEFAVTSRKKVSNDSGGPFFRTQDSGFGIRGYTNSFRPANFIYWRVDGNDVRMFKGLEPFSLFPRTPAGKWNKIILCLDNEKKTFSFFCDGSEVLTLHKVDLTGKELNAVFLSSQNNEYRNVKAVCITK